MVNWVMSPQYAESRESQVNCNTGPIVTSHVTLPHLVQAGFLIAIISIFYGAASEKKSS